MAVILILGRRGYGKTTLALHILRRARSAGKKLYGFSPMQALPKQIHPLQSLSEIQNLHRAAILIDDATGYLRGALYEVEIRQAVVGSRHRDLDLIFVYHNVGQTPPFLFSMADSVVFFGISDTLETLKQKLSFDPDLLRIAMEALVLPRYSWIGYNLNRRSIIRQL